MARCYKEALEKQKVLNNDTEQASRHGVEYSISIPAANDEVFRVEIKQVIHLWQNEILNQSI